MKTRNDKPNFNATFFKIKINKFAVTQWANGRFRI